MDVVGLGIIGGYYQYKKMIKISNAIRKSKNKTVYILGGHGPSPEPEYFLKKSNANFVVLGEGEETIVELLNNLHSPETVKGIAYWRGDKVCINERRKVIKNIDNIPFPLWEKFPINYYVLKRELGFVGSDRVMQMVSGRGCPYRCNFCYRMDSGFRPRSIDSIVEEIKILKSEYYINGIEFADELLMSSVQRTHEICERFLHENLNIKWACNGRLNFAEKKLLQLMKKSGCVFINYGIESIDDATLKIMNKQLNTKQIFEGVQNTVDVGIHPGLNIIFGNIGETKDILRKDVDFIKRFGDCLQMRTIRPVTPYPGSELYYYAIKNGLLGGPEDFYEHKHINSDLLSVNFTDMNEEDFYKELYDANTELIDDFYKKSQQNVINEANKLYKNFNINFRGFRQI
jgi:radical SAM superfamily enzyme YgiQ (UPF0313 family)